MGVGGRSGGSGREGEGASAGRQWRFDAFESAGHRSVIFPQGGRGRLLERGASIERGGGVPMPGLIQVIMRVRLQRPRRIEHSPVEERSRACARENEL